MPRTINFVSERHRTLTKAQQQDRVWLKWASIGFGIVLVIFIGIMSIQLYFTYQLAQLQERHDDLKGVVVSRDDTERSYLVLLNKVKTLAQLMITRSNKQQAIAFFTTLFGPDVLIKELNFEASGQIISFGIEAPSVFTLEKVLETLSKAEVRDQFGSVTTSELRRGASGAYNMTVTVTLKATQKQTAAAPGASADQLPESN
jgi:hypothetical protein